MPIGVCPYTFRRQPAADVSPRLGGAGDLEPSAAHTQKTQGRIRGQDGHLRGIVIGVGFQAGIPILGCAGIGTQHAFVHPALLVAIVENLEPTFPLFQKCDYTPRQLLIIGQLVIDREGDGSDDFAGGSIAHVGSHPVAVRNQSLYRHALVRHGVADKRGLNARSIRVHERILRLPFNAGGSGVGGGNTWCSLSTRTFSLRPLLPRSIVPQPAQTGILQPGFTLGP